MKVVTEAKFSSIIIRLLTIFVFSLLYIFAGLVVAENKELHKFIPPTSTRSLMILVGYIGAIISMNYILAIRGKNFTHWKTEIAFVSFFTVFVTGWLASYLFPLSAKVPKPAYKIWVFSDNIIQAPDFKYLFFWILLLPIGKFCFSRLRILYTSKMIDIKN
jgi:hypothetical protein